MISCTFWNDLRFTWGSFSMLLVLAAFLVDWRKLCAPRFHALALAKRDNAVCDAASEPSLRNVLSVARAHFLEGFRIALRLSARPCIAFPFLFFLPLEF